MSRKVGADMFGLALRSYQRKIQRLTESNTDRGRSLWESQATCVATSSTDPACGATSPAKACDVPCVATADCDATPGAPVCVSGFCRSIATATMPPRKAGEVDGGVSGAAGKGSGGRSTSGDAAIDGGGGGSDASLGSGGAGGPPSGTGGAGGGSGGASAGGDAGDAAAPDCETRVLYDPKNCGRCGHDCQGGICASGICQPTTLALGQSTTRSIAVDESNMYWITNTTLNKVPAKGGAALGAITPLASGLTEPQVVAAGGNAVLWTSYADSANVASVPKAGGPVVGVATGKSQRPIGLAVDANYAYWGPTTTDAVERVPLAGGSVVPVVSGAGAPYRMALDSTNIYWTERTNGLVVTALIGGGAGSPLATGQNSPAGIGAYAGHVYWATTTQSGSVTGMSADGRTSETIADGQDYPYGVAADSSGIYWTNIGTGTPPSGAVLMRALSGGSVVLLASSQAGPSEIATNSNSVFWLNSATGVIMKVAKP